MQSPDAAIPREAAKYWLVLGPTGDCQNTGTLHEELGGAALAAHDCLVHQLANGEHAEVTIEMVHISHDYKKWWTATKEGPLNDARQKK